MIKVANYFSKNSLCPLPLGLRVLTIYILCLRHGLDCEILLKEDITVLSLIYLITILNSEASAL